MKEALEVQAKNSASLDGNNNNNTNNASNSNKNNATNNNNKRKKDICDAIAKTVKKKSKKPAS